MIAASPSKDPTTAPAMVPGLAPLELPDDEAAALALALDAAELAVDDEDKFEVELELARDEDDECAAHPSVGKLFANPSIGCAYA